jgi:isopenicillin N synthase-like dioxygenase
MDVRTTTDWNRVAKVLWEEGVAIFPIDESLVEPAREGFKQFLKRRDEKQDHADWCFQRPGESEHDLGLIQRAGGEHDVKSFFHQDSVLTFDSHFVHQFTEPQDVHFLVSNHELLNHVSEAGRFLTKALQEQFGPQCSSAYSYCSRVSMPYCTTTLRSLYYPDGPAQSGAKAHIDRGFLTIHLGDQGGNLQMLINEEWENISPPAGYAVAFFGVKALWVTKGKKGPLRHRSVTIPGHDRFAFVHFGHVPVLNYQVTDAQAALEYWNSLHKT